MPEDNTRKDSRVHRNHHIEEQIRQRAYELYENRGREDGHDLDDWFRAEQEIAFRETRKAAA